MQSIRRWDVPIRADHPLNCELRDLRLDRGLRIQVQEYLPEANHYGKTWAFRFHRVQAFRLLTEELTSGMYLARPADAKVFFIVEESEWFAALGGRSAPHLDATQHYGVACYDELIEVIAHGYELVEVSEEDHHDPA